MSAKKILWHDSYGSGYKNVMSSDEAFEKYQESIIKFATNYGYDTVSLTALGSEISGGFLPPSKNRTAYYYINKFIAAAEKVGLSVALNVFQKDGETDTVDQLVADLKANIKASKNLSFGIDHETNNLTAKTYESEKVKWITALDKHFGEGNYDNFYILGGLAQPENWTASSNFKNGYEYYTIDTKDWKTNAGIFNETISGNLPEGKSYLNDPNGAVEYIQDVIKNGDDSTNPPTILDGPIDKITGEYSGQVPIFSIGTGEKNTLGGTTKVIGPAVFGTWDVESFHAFLDAWNDAYPGTTDIIVYHGDQLPLTWIPSSESASPEAFYSELFAMM